MNESRSQQFFHGTTADIPIGGKIVPSTESGRQVFTHLHGNEGDAGRAYATTNENTAWNFADVGQTRFPGSRARVYEVTPDTTPTIGRENENSPEFQGPRDFATSEYHAPSWTVTGRRDIMPGHQGTLPLNWNQFSTGDTIGDVNHPSPEEFDLNDKLQNINNL